MLKSYRIMKMCDAGYIESYQRKVDEQIRYFGRVGGALIDDIDCAGLYLDMNNKVKLK